MMISRIVLGLAACGLLTLVNNFPAYASFFTKLKSNKDNELLIRHTLDTAAEAASIKKSTKTNINPINEALTFSRFMQNGQVHILAVTQDNGDTLTGIDISIVLNHYETNVFDVIKGMSYQAIEKLIGSSAKLITIRYTELLPSVAGSEHLAIGINYAEHGKETGQVRPFMFPKLVKTDPAVHSLKYQPGWLLDHEVELGIVFPEPVCAVKDLDEMMVGFLVVNDFTDRAELMRKMDSQIVVGGKGFPDAKSKAGFLPTGPYLVIPKRWQTFVKELHLGLKVNGVTRQDGYAKDMVWNIETIVARSLVVKGKHESYFHDRMIPLFKGDCIPANSIIITGTPSGIVFNAPSKGFIIGSVTKYIFTGGFFNDKMHPYILKQYLKKELKNPRYLKPGDEVETTINYLGTITTTITPPDSRK
jgi:2,4-didehydro-3-deoxy-L-rhamnonate hydrolase